MQPYLFPHFEYFQQIEVSDVWVSFEEVQFIDKGWINRNRILHPEPEKGWTFITVPLEKRKQFARIDEVRVSSSSDWRNRIRGQLGTYRNAPFFNETLDLVEQAISLETNVLSDLVFHSIDKVCQFLGITTELLRSSDLEDVSGRVQHGGQWGLLLSELLGADSYLNPEGGRDLFDRQEFDAAGIRLEFLEPAKSVYFQGGREFIPSLSILDQLMWEGRDGVRDRFWPPQICN